MEYILDCIICYFSGHMWRYVEEGVLIKTKNSDNTIYKVKKPYSCCDRCGKIVIGKDMREE